MSEKASFWESAFQSAEATVGDRYVMPSPAEEVMAREEGERPVEGGGGWLLSAVLELVFADERPMDWRYAARRGVALIRIFSPWLLAGQPGDELEELKGISSTGTFPVQLLQSLGLDEEETDRLRKLLGWIYDRRGRGWLKHATMKLYFLARGYHSQALRKGQPGRFIKGKWRDERQVDMTLHDFAIAFGETADKGARSRWCERAKQMMPEGIYTPANKGRETVEKCRAAAMGNGNRLGGKNQPHHHDDQGEGDEAA